MARRICILLFFLFPFFQLSAQNPDINLLHKFNAPYENGLHTWLKITNSAYWIPPAYVGTNLAYGLIADNRSARVASLQGAISIITGGIITQGLKPIVNRARPAEAYPDLIHTYSITGSRSFPSGHSGLAFSTATSMAYQGSSWFVYVPVFSWSTTIGYSRMRLGKHYPTDVLAGVLIGIGSGIFGNWVTKKIVN